ncbi:MAG: hypothetical protein AB7W59_18795 [Acidimicrobiia bacterium]
MNLPAEPPAADGSLAQGRLHGRLDELRAERAKGEQMLAQLEAERAELLTQLARISGAIQVLEELVAEGVDPETPHDDRR